MAKRKKIAKRGMTIVQERSSQEERPKVWLGKSVGCLRKLEKESDGTCSGGASIQALRAFIPSNTRERQKITSWSPNRSHQL